MTTEQIVACNNSPKEAYEKFQSYTWDHARFLRNLLNDANLNRAFNALANAKVTDIPTIASQPDEALTLINGLGPTTIEAIDYMLSTMLTTEFPPKLSF